MSAATYDFPIERGASFTRILIYKDPNGVPINLSAFLGARLQIRDEIGGKVYADLSTSNGGITFTPLEGKIKIFLTKQQTMAMKPLTDFRQYVYDLFLDVSATEAIKVLKGTCPLEDAVTKA